MEPIKLSGFELISKIGQGGMGVVWKARQVSLDRIVAVKLLLPGLSRDPADVERLLTEARTAARLKHPGIVQVYDTSEENGVYYFVMEYVAGYSVGAWLRRKGVLPEKDALIVGQYVAQALEYAWNTAGLIHCDIKPDNIMVDQDGTIKVADLGLSRTAGMRARAADREDITGTPSYMSPEQVKGDAELDFRTDIYSLGATLYHLMTGRRLFQDRTDAEAVDQQVNGQDADPLDVNPALSPGAGWLLEKMLVKDPKQRQPNWRTVMVDMEEVAKGRMPYSAPAPEGASTVRRSRRRIEMTRQARRKRGERSLVRVLVGVGVVLLVVLALWVFVRMESARIRARQAGPPPQTNLVAMVSPEAALAARTRAAEQQYQEAQVWEKQHPLEFAEIIARYRAVASAGHGTPSGPRAEADMRRVRAAAVAHVLAELDRATRPLAGDERFAEAAEQYERYAGPWAAETQADRLAKARELRVRAAEVERRRQAEQRWKACLAAVASHAAAGRFTSGRQTVETALEEPILESRRGELQSLRDLLDRTLGLQERILESFRQQVDTPMTLSLARGEDVAVVVKGVIENKIRCQVADGQAEVRITVDELSYKEKLRRVGTNDTPEVALFRGALAFNASAQPQAREYFSRAGPVLSGPLLALVGGGEPAEPKPEPAAADAAETALVELLRRAGIAVGPYDEAAWLKAVAEARLDAVTASTVLEALIAYLEQYRESPFVARARPVLAALERKCQRASDGEDGGPVSPEAAGTLDDEGVANLLIAKNPGLTAAEIECTRKEGGIDALTVRSGAFKDFSPVASLPKLRSFTYEAVNAGTVVDLRPLKFAASLAEIVLKRCELPDPAVLGDLTASRLVLEGCGIRDLGGLAKSAVTDLDLSDTDVKDLTPLRSLKLDSLTLNNTRITALNLPSGMPLRRLSANGTMIRDLTGLRTLPLEEVRLAGIKAFDFQPLRGIKLRYLDLSDTQFRDPTLCQGMPLVGLYLRRTNISDLSRFRGTDLEELDISYTSVKDLSPLRGLRLRWLDISGLRLGSESPAVLAEMPLRWLSAADTTLSDLSLLRGKPLRFLNVANTPVRDLTALGGMPLEHLDIGETSVADLAPLKGMPLRVLRCRGSRVTDPLQVVELPVEELTFNIEPGDYAMLAKKMPRLRQLNGEPVPTRDRRP